MLTAVSRHSRQGAAIAADVTVLRAKLKPCVRRLPPPIDAITSTTRESTRKSITPAMPSHHNVITRLSPSADSDPALPRCEQPRTGIPKAPLPTSHPCAGAPCLDPEADCTRDCNLHHNCSLHPPHPGGLHHPLDRLRKRTAPSSANSYCCARASRSSWPTCSTRGAEGGLPLHLSRRGTTERSPWCLE